MTLRFFLCLLCLAMGFQFAPAASASAPPILELYGTLQSMGVTVSIAANDDPDRDALANVAYRIRGVGPFREGFPLSRIKDTRFVGSLFWLYPGTIYEVRVTFADPDGILDGVMVAVEGSTRAEIAIPLPNHSYYVSPTGSGTFCVLAAPCALIEGLNEAQPGDEVVLRGGVYYEGEISLPHSGVAGAPIVIRGYPGEQAVLDGADPQTFAWVHQGGGVWATTVNVTDTHLITANGQRLYPYQDLSDLQNLIWNVPGFYDSGLTVYVHLAADADPNTAAMAVSRKGHALWVEQQYVYILGITFRHYGQGGYPRAIYLKNGSDNLIRDCLFATNDVGIAIKGESHRNLIEGNEFSDTIYGWPWDSLYAGSGLEGGGGIRFWDPNAGFESVSRGNVIRRNVFHGFFDGFGACPALDHGVTNETDVYENLVFNGGDDGMETDGSCSNVRIWGNAFHDTLTGISLAPPRVGPVYAMRNLMYRTGWTAFKFQNQFPGAGPMYLFHNTVAAGVGWCALCILETSTWPLLVSRNNIWVGDNKEAICYAVDDPIDFDYDDLWRTGTGKVIWWNGIGYRSPAELCEVHSQECHASNVVPGFVSAPGDDYRLTSSSQLIDAGLRMPGINDRFAGSAPDIGAIEYEPYGVKLEALPTTQPISPGGVVTYVIEVRPSGGFSSAVSLATTYASPSLTLWLTPTAFAPPAYATLTITDSHPGSQIVPGLWHSIPLVASGGGVTAEITVSLLVGGAQLYLPVAVRDHN